MKFCLPVGRFFRLRVQIIANSKYLLRLLCASTALNTFLTNFTFNIQFNISTKSAHDILWLINSTSIEFNMRLRPMIKSYFTKAMELVKRVDEAKFKLNKYKFGQ